MKYKRETNQKIRKKQLEIWSYQNKYKYRMIEEWLNEPTKKSKSENYIWLYK